MKRFMFIFLITFCMLFPFTAIAIQLGTGTMQLSYSTPTGGGYYLDYDAWVTSSTFGYTTPGYVEVFCVSGSPLASGNFTFYTITTDLNTIISPGTFEKLARAAWVADHWMDYIGSDYIGSNDPDIVKGEAQKAVWKIVGVMEDIVGESGLALIMYNAAMSQTPEANYNWYFALDSQDYIVPAPVPEPTTILLLGSGLLAIGLLGRKKFKK